MAAKKTTGATKGRSATPKPAPTARSAKAAPKERTSPEPAPQGRPFATPAELEAWLKVNHATKSELWVRMFKKASKRPSVTWNDCVLAALAWGWIDGIRKSLDEVSFVQRFTPRRPKSTWSKINCAHAERLIAEGKMQPAGLAQVEAARADGRWDRAYSGYAQMVIPDDFLQALAKNPRAKKFFAGLDRRNHYAVYHRLTSAKRPETRLRRIAMMVAALGRGEAFH